MKKLSTKQILLLALPVLFMLVPMASAHTITVPTNVYFGLPSYSTYINFNTQQTFGQVYRESSYWYFDGYGFQVQNANMTITNFFVADKLIFTVSAPSETTSTTKVYVGDRGKPRIVRVDGITQSYGDTWTYDENAKVATVSVTHSSTSQVVLDWSEEGLPTDGDATDPTPSEKYMLTVTVVDETGPVWNVKVSVLLNNLAQIASKTTRASGEARFTLDEATYWVIAETAGKVGTGTVYLYKDTALTLTLEERVAFDPFDWAHKNIVEPVAGAGAWDFMVNLGGFMALFGGVLVVGTGFWVDEDGVKIVGLLTALLGAVVIVYVFIIKR